MARSFVRIDLLHHGRTAHDPPRDRAGNEPRRPSEDMGGKDHTPAPPDGGDLLAVLALRRRRVVAGVPCPFHLAPHPMTAPTTVSTRGLKVWVPLIAPIGAWAVHEV